MMNNSNKSKFNTYDVLRTFGGEGKKGPPPKKIPPKKAVEVKKTANKDKKKPVDRNPNVPDLSFGDLYCPLCDSHMNSQQMWDAHIAGKKHIKSVKKGDPSSKYTILNEASKVEDLLQDCEEPIVGLQFITEIKRRDPSIPSMFNCFLCHASLATAQVVLDHVISFKHRSNFIKNKDPEKYKFLSQTELTKSSMEALMADAAAEYETSCGRGEVVVKVEKEKTTTGKRYYGSDSDDDVPYYKKKDQFEKGLLSKNKKLGNANFEPIGSRAYSPSRKSPDYKDDRSKDFPPYRRKSPETFKYDNVPSHSRNLSGENGLNPYGLSRSGYNIDEDKMFSKHRVDLSPPRYGYERKPDYSFPSPPIHNPYERDERLVRSDPFESEKRVLHRENFEREKLSRTIPYQLDERSSLRDSLPERPPVYQSSPTYPERSYPEMATKSEDLYSRRNETKVSEAYQRPVDPVSKETSSKEQYGPEPPKAEQPQQPAEQIIEDFLQKIISLPAMSFFRVVLFKLETIEGLNNEEFKTLYEVIMKAQNILCKDKLPERSAQVKSEPSSTNSNIASRRPQTSVNQLDYTSYPTAVKPEVLPDPTQNKLAGVDIASIYKFIQNQRTQSKSQEETVSPHLQNPSSSYSYTGSLNPSVTSVPQPVPPPNYPAPDIYFSSSFPSNSSQYNKFGY